MTAADFFLDTPLYTSVKIEEISELRSIVSSAYCQPFEGYNPIDRYDTTFDLQQNDFLFIKITDNIYLSLVIKCRRSNTLFNFHGFWSAGTLMKTGQFPSLADFHIAQVKQFDKVLNKDQKREFTKAIGLAANGVGIGSFVYLRRIFEALVYESAKDKNAEFDLQAFKSKRMSEKIGLLSDVLPDFLVEHKELYSILSKGIHELTEQECLEHFSVVRMGIEMILEEKLEKYNKAKRAKEASDKIKAIAQAVNSK